MNISLSPFAPENLVSRDGFGSPVPRQPAHLHTQTESGAYLRGSSRVPRRRSFIHFKTAKIRHRVSPEFIGSSRICVPMAFTAESPAVPPRVVRILFVCLFIAHLRSMGLNVLGYQFHIMYIIYIATLASFLGSLRVFPSLSGLRVRVFIAMQVQYSYTSSNRWLDVTNSRSHVFSFGTRMIKYVILLVSRIELPHPHYYCCYNLAIDWWVVDIIVV